MAIVKKSSRVSRSEGDSWLGSRGSISADDSDHRPESSGVSQVDSGMELDSCGDSMELGEPVTELCQVGDQRFGIPLELCDLPDLYSVLSVETWNDLLSEEERFALAQYLPDMDQETFSWTLKELFSGGNFHFGSPLAEFFSLLKGGQLEPTVVLYRQSLHVIKRREYYRFLCRYQDSMVGSIVRIRDTWESCVGYGVEERMRGLNILRSRRSMQHDGDVFGGSVMDSEDETSLEKVRRKRFKMSRRALCSSKPLLDESVVFEREIPKGILKVAAPKASGKEYFGLRDLFASPVEPALQMKATLPMSLKPQPLQDRVDRLRYGTVQRSRNQMRVSDDDGGYLEEWGANGDWDASHENSVARASLQKPGKKRRDLGAYDRGNQMGYGSAHHVGLLHSLGSIRNTTREVTLSSYDCHPQDSMKKARLSPEKGQLCPVKNQSAHPEVEDFGGKKLKEEEGLKTSKSKTDSDQKTRHGNSFLEKIGESHFRYDPTARASRGKTRSTFVHEEGMKLNAARENLVFDRGEETESDSSEQFEEVWDGNHAVRQLANPSGAMEGYRSVIIRLANNPKRANKISKVGKKAYAVVSCNMETMKDGLGQTSRDVHVQANGSRKRGQAIDSHIVETDSNVQLNLTLSGCTSITKKQKEKLDTYMDEADESSYLLSTTKRMDDPGHMRKREKLDAEAGTGSLAAVAPDRSILTERTKEIEKSQEKQFTLIAPTIHTGFSFSIIHLLSAIRKAMVTAPTEDTMELHHHYKKDDGIHNLKREAQDMNTADHAGQKNLPSLTIHEIVNRVRLNPGDPCILETQEPLEDLVRGALKIFSSKTAPLGAKGWKALVHYENSNKSWCWIGPASILFDNDTIEEETSSEAWDIPHKMLVKLVDAFANWLKNGQEILQQIGSLPAPPMIVFLNMDENERFKDLKNQKCPTTISSSSEEARAYFRKEEILRYSIPDRAFSYTASDGKKSTVAPLRRGGGKPTSKARDHYMLKPDRPPHVTILCLVRDAAARLPGSIGTRADVCTLIRDSQYISEDVSDAKVNQIVSGALDRLHYERDPCVQFDSDRKLWVYLHGDREEEDFEDGGTSSTKKWKKTVRDSLGYSGMGAANDVNYHGDGDTGPVGSSAGYDVTSEVNIDYTSTHSGEKDELGYSDFISNMENARLFVDSATGNRSRGNLMMQEVRRSNFYGEREMLCPENSSNKDFSDEAFGRKRPVRHLTASLS